MQAVRLSEFNVLYYQVATFGVDFAKHLCTTHCAIPHVMLMCINHIELIGMDIKVQHRM